MAEMTALERVGRAIAEANQEDFDETLNLHLAMAEAALVALRDLPPEVATAHVVGFLRTWTDPHDCLGPEQELALGLDEDGADSFAPAHARIAEHAKVAWWDAIDTMLGKPIASFSNLSAALAEGEEKP